MEPLPDISRVAALIGDPLRAHMLTLLLGGRAWTAGELARAVEASPQTASNHLAQLLAGHLVQVNHQGRHRYYRLAGRDVAQLLESLVAFEHGQDHPLLTRTPPELRFARRCYDHLAGELGVLLLDALLECQHIVPSGRELHLTCSGKAWVQNLGIDLQSLEGRRRPLLRPCLDWSERRFHLGGALGAALLTQFQALHWLSGGRERQIHLTVPGQSALERQLQLRLPQLRS